MNRTGTGASQTLAGGDFADTLVGRWAATTGSTATAATTASTAAPATTPRSSAAPWPTTRSSGRPVLRARAFTIADLRGGSPDGTDTLTGIESLQFSDTVLDIAQFPANIDLSALDGTTGFKLSGAAAGDYSGFSVASAGDVNGDGFADLIVGAGGADPHGSTVPARATWCSARLRASPPTSISPASTAQPASSSAARRQAT